MPVAVVVVLAVPLWVGNDGRGGDWGELNALGMPALGDMGDEVKDEFDWLPCPAGVELLEEDEVVEQAEIDNEGALCR